MDKALLRLPNGRTLLGAICEQAIAAGFDVAVIGRSATGDVPSQVRFVEDVLPDHGPVGGLLTAFELFRTDVMALGCDMPNLTPDAIRWLADAAASSPANDGIVATRNGQPEFLFAVYRQPCFQLIQQQIEAQKLAMHQLVAAGNFHLEPLPPRLTDCATSINTPKEAAAAGLTGQAIN